MTFNRDIHHRRSIRLRNYDYSDPGAYFVTICTFQRECLFGEVAGEKVNANEAGRIVTVVWQELGNKFPSISVDSFIVMPNHIHGILVLKDCVGAGLALPGLLESGAASSAPTLGDVVRTFKSKSAISVNRALGRQGIPLWQRNYYERVIRTEEELRGIQQYIAENPVRWQEDENHPMCIK